MENQTEQEQREKVILRSRELVRLVALKGESVVPMDIDDVRALLQLDDLLRLAQADSRLLDEYERVLLENMKRLGRRKQEDGPVFIAGGLGLAVSCVNGTDGPSTLRSAIAAALRLDFLQKKDADRAERAKNAKPGDIDVAPEPAKLAWFGDEEQKAEPFGGLEPSTVVIDDPLRPADTE